MTNEQRMKNISVPAGMIDVVLDTDAYNEIDDQFAIAYLLRAKEKCNTKAIYAAPFKNSKSTDAGDGMEKSYDEIVKLLQLLEEDVPVFKGSTAFMTDEKVPVISDAARDLAERANAYTPENPLYVVAIGAITNVASAIILNPKVAENTVIVWLGGHARHVENTKEFNMRQDYPAARVVMGCGAPFVQLPCKGVVSAFTVSGPELEYWFKGKNKVSTYLAENAIREAETYAKGKAWTRVIWDVTAVAWLLNEKDVFMNTEVIPTRLPTDEGIYADKDEEFPMRYVYFIKRDALLNDMIARITK